ncbi:MAG: homoserine kinase [Deltaproteobacteria bacterium]|nr:homoserine kinase [Deltaproteobacteria bacterium]
MKESSATREEGISAWAPATVANVGPGFDVFGFAMAEPGVTVTVRFGDAGGRGIRIRTNRPELPTDPTRNTAGAAAQALMAHYGVQEDVEVKIAAAIPIGSGMGSSAASAVAAAMAANQLFGGTLTREALLPFAVAGEGVASGTPHADNVAPALFGGWQLVIAHQPTEVMALPTPHDLHYVVVHPAVVVETAAARKILPAAIPLGDAVRQWAQVGALVAALYEEDLPRLGSLLDDRLIEPLRSRLIPGYAAVKRAATAAGALGCTIAGSGPAMCSVVRRSDAARVETAMSEAFRAAHVACTSWIGAFGAPGAHIASHGQARGPRQLASPVGSDPASTASVRGRLHRLCRWRGRREPL